MDSGKCVEYGTPAELLNKKEEPKIFFNMMKQAGIQV